MNKENNMNLCNIDNARDDGSSVFDSSVDFSSEGDQELLDILDCLNLRKVLKKKLFS